MKNDVENLNLKKKLRACDLNNSQNSELFKEIMQRLDINKPRQILFHALHPEILSVPNCPCGTKLEWNDDKKQYRTYCSKACTAKYTVSLKKKLNIEALGVEWHTQLPEWRDKVANTSLQKFGVDHFSKTQEHTNQMRATNLVKFGVPYPSQNPTIQQKTKQTCIEKYGVDNPAKNNKVKSKLRVTCTNKYGVDNAARQNYSAEAIAFLNDPILFTNECVQFSVRALSKKYGISVNPIYSRANDLNISIPKFNRSSFESEVLDFIKSKYDGSIVSGDRSLFNGKEVDILLPDLRLAVECNGTYWHTEARGRDKQYHIEKTNTARNQGFQLIHIWEHDWMVKSEIIKSMMSHKLGKSSTIYARNTRIASISKSEAEAFFSRCHLQGNIPTNGIRLGLFDKDNILVAAMLFSKSRFNKQYEWELLRFANLLGTNVIGGASKLFSHIIRTTDCVSVISYADRSITSGAMYSKLGFQWIRTNSPGYKYTKNFIDVYDRQTFQKHKLKKILPMFDPTLSESVNMRNNDYHKLWDSGQDVYVWKRAVALNNP